MHPYRAAAERLDLEAGPLRVDDRVYVLENAEPSPGAREHAGEIGEIMLITEAVVVVAFGPGSCGLVWPSELERV